MRVSSKKSGGTTKAGKGRGPQKSQSSKNDSVKLKPLGEVNSALTSDSVEVADHTTAIQVIKELVSSSPDVRSNEVERVSKLLKSGQFKIDYEKIAEAFIREVIVNEISRKQRKK